MSFIQCKRLTRLALLGMCLVVLVPGQVQADLLVTRPLQPAAPIPAVGRYTESLPETRTLTPDFEPYSTMAATRAAHPGRRAGGPGQQPEALRPLTWREGIVQALAVQVVVMAGIPQKMPQGSKKQSSPKDPSTFFSAPTSSSAGGPGGGGPGPGGPSVTPTPEPASMVSGLIGVGLGGLAALRRLRRRRKACARTNPT